MKVVARAPAKLVLFGEYAVLEGAPAIVAAIDRCATVTVDTEAHRGVESNLGRDAATAWFDAWIAAAERDAPDVHVELHTGELFANGTDAKLGVGSSAALTVAMGAALREAEGEPVADDGAFAAYLDAHHRLQGGAGSGIDVAASFHGGVIAWWQSRRVERLGMPADLHFACVWTGTAASTPDMLEHVRALERREPGAYAASMERLGDSARRALDAFRAGRADDVVALAGAYHDAMAELGTRAGAPIISGAHRELAEIAGGEDVTYKPSGAGGGDVGLLFSTSGERLAETCERCLTAGYRIVNVRIEDQGVTVSNV